MREYSKIVLLFVLSAFALYGAFAFILLQPNPLCWEIDGRVVYVVALCAISIAFLAHMDHGNDK